MPELPEVEVVRAGLAPAVADARVVSVEIFDERSLKRHAAGALDFERRLTGSLLHVPVRRGKFLWIPLRTPSTRPDADPSNFALLCHLGMSGQLLIRELEAPEDRHVRVRIVIETSDDRLLRIDFADQRIFGSLALDELDDVADGHPAGFGSTSAQIPRQVRHIARDALDPFLDEVELHNKLSRRKSEIKRALLDQQLISGIGNIYADEALWASRIHPETPAEMLSPGDRETLLAAVRQVFSRALEEGGTSFDAQYVNVNGQAGYFAHSLNAYGRHTLPCPRCGAAIVRQQFMNRSSHFCPECQPLSHQV